jgi:hypothetical protein
MANESTDDSEALARSGISERLRAVVTAVGEALTVAREFHQGHADVRQMHERRQRPGESEDEEES